MENYYDYSDEELVLGCKENIRKYQEMLYKKYAGKLYSICLSYASDRDVAMDILQDGFIKIFKKMDTYQLDGSLEGWMRRVMTNTAIDYYRKHKKSNQFLDVNEVVIEDERAEDSFSKLRVEEIFTYLKRLPEGARVIFNLYAVEGYSHKEISEKLNISEGTSKSQFSRARMLLQKWITGSGD